MLDPTRSAPENWTASYVVTIHLVVALQGHTDFRTVVHYMLLKEGRADILFRAFLNANQALVDDMGTLMAHGARQLFRRTKTVTMEIHYIINSEQDLTGGSGVEECPLPSLRHGALLYTPSCNGFGAQLSISHSLDFKMAALSPLVTTSCVTRLQTCPSRPSHPRMCATTPSSTQSVKFGT